MLSRVSVLKVGLVLFLAAGLALISTGPVLAAENPPDGQIPAGTTIDDDVFLNADSVNMDGSVSGSLFAAGNIVTINGTVDGDVIAMASYVVVGSQARIGGNLFAGAQVVEVHGQVEGSIAAGANAIYLKEGAAVIRNAYLGGFAIQTEAGSQIGKDAYLGAYQADLAGSMDRDLHLGGAALDLSGSVGRNAWIEIASPADRLNTPFHPMMFTPQQPGLPPMPPEKLPGLRIAPQAKIGGKLTYTSSTEQASAIQSAPADGVVYQTPVPDEAQTAKKQTAIEVRYPVLGWFFKLLRNLVTLMILGALVLWLAPAVLRRVVDFAASKPLPSAGYGALSVLVGYAGAFIAGLVLLLAGILIAVVSLGGLSRTVFGVGFSGLALLTAAFTFLVAYGSKLVVAYLIGDLFVKKVMPQASSPHIWALVIGVVFYAILRSIPFLGWLIGIAVTLIGLGAMWLAYQSRRAPAPAAA